MTALAWHPTTEGRLAFGTNEGRVGVFDTLAPAKAPWLSRSYHKGTVYNLNWAPAPGRPAAEALYSCGAGRILIHADPPADKDAADFNKLVDVPPLALSLPARFRCSSGHCQVNQLPPTDGWNISGSPLPF